MAISFGFELGLVLQFLLLPLFFALAEQLLNLLSLYLFVLVVLRYRYLERNRNAPLLFDHSFD